MENTHKQDDREFYAGSNYQTIEKLEKAMRGYNGRSNEVRATKALGWKTTEQALERAYVRAEAYLLHGQACNAPKGTSECTHSEVDQGQRKDVQSKKTTSAAVAKPKKLTAVDRYLNWLEWDDTRKNTKALILLPQMSRSYSNRAPRA